MKKIENFWNFSGKKFPTGIFQVVFPISTKIIESP